MVERVREEFAGIINSFIRRIDGEPRINELLRPPFALMLHGEIESLMRAHAAENYRSSRRRAESIAGFIAEELKDKHYHNSPVKNGTKRSAIFRTEHTTIVHNPVTPEEKAEMVKRLNSLKGHLEEYASRRG